MKKNKKKSVEIKVGANASATILLSVDRPKGLRPNDTTKRCKGRPFHS